MMDDHSIMHGRAPKVAVACLFIIPGGLGIVYFALGALT